MPLPSNRPRARRGVLLLEALSGVLLIAAIASLLTVALARQGRASVRLAEDRASLRRAESALAALNARPPTTMPAGVSIRRLDAPAAQGVAWYVAVAGDGPRRVELVGVAPIDAAGGVR